MDSTVQVVDSVEADTEMDEGEEKNDDPDTKDLFRLELDAEDTCNPDRNKSFNTNSLIRELTCERKLSLEAKFAIDAKLLADSGAFWAMNLSHQRDVCSKGSYEMDLVASAELLTISGGLHVPDTRNQEKVEIQEEEGKLESLKQESESYNEKTVLRRTSVARALRSA